MATQRTTYDEHGNPLEAWWTDGTLRHTTRASYDGFGRVTEQLLVRAAPGGETIESHTRFHYDQHSGHADQDGVVLPGALSWAETKTVGAVYHTYDPFGRARATTYRYDGYPHAVREHADYTAPGRLEYLLLDTGETTDAVGYEYDSAGRVARVTDAFTGTPYWHAASVEFDGFRAAIELGNGIVETYSREATGRRRPTGWKVPTAQGTFSGRAIELDAAGRVTHEELITPTGSERRGYAFDGLGRLSKAVHLGGRWPGTEAYAHDALGNLTARTATSGLPDRTFEQDPQDPDRLCRVNASGGGPCELTYDGAGNVVADLSYGATQPRHLAYDAGGRITSITRGPYGASMTYGPAGRATLAVDGFRQRKHFYFGGLVEIRYLGSKAGFERRIPGPGGVVATRRLSTVGDTTVYHHGDGRANRVFTDAAGQLVQHVDYTTFGQAVSSASADDSLQSDDLWNGGDDLPELGLVLLGPRAYDPDLGRFLQRDPIAITARASSANPYAFSFSDPINFADPSGLSPEGTRTWQQHQQTWGPMAGAMTGLFWLQFSGDIKRRPPRPTRPASAGSVPDVVLGGRVSVGVGVESTRVHLGTACGRACRVWRSARAAGGYGVGVARGAGKGALRLGVRAAKVAACPICVAVDDVMSAPEGVRGVTQLGGALVDDPVGTVVTLASDPELAGEVLFDAVLTKKVGPGVLTRLGICRGGVCPCFTAGTPVRTGDGSAPIETLAVGQRVPPDHAACQHDSFDDHVAVQLEMDGPDGDRFDIVLLRPRDWLAAVGAEPGATIWVALTELNVEGPARVLALDPTVTVPDGPGCPITGTIRHLATSLVVLAVEGSDAPINATPQHPFYSVDRDGWVAAGDLQVGELVATETGTTRITSSGATSVPPTDVYNLEVHGAHEYFVHDAAVRVHNNYAATTAAGGGARPFAMGLTDEGLEAFANARGATTWRQLPDVANWRSGVLDKLADPNTMVHFNLDGVDVWQGVSRAAAGRGGPTDWELLTIRQNPQSWDTIQFWRGGQPVPNPFQ